MAGGTTVAAVSALLVLVAGCTAGEPASDPAAPSPTPAAEPTSLAAYATEGVVVARAPFCDRVSPTGIEHALGGAAGVHEQHGNGDPVRLPDGTRALAHEYGCEWVGPQQVTARAWVFVPPVSRSRALDLVDEAATGRCTRTGTGAYGDPSVALRCRTAEGVEASWRGLFGDAWLVCTLAAPEPAGLTQRAGDWCVAVLEAARA